MQDMSATHVFQITVQERSLLIDSEMVLPHIYSFAK